MTRQPFDQFDVRMSTVKRWSIVPTIQQQSNAEHCFNVARIAAAIWVPWLGGRSDMLSDVYEWALHHDDEEQFMGDVQSPASPYFDKERFRADHKHLLRIPGPKNSDVRNCVKLADHLEMVAFVSLELAMGNKLIEQVYLERVAELDRYTNSTFGAGEFTVHRLKVDQWVDYWRRVEWRIK